MFSKQVCSVCFFVLGLCSCSAAVPSPARVSCDVVAVTRAQARVDSECDVPDAGVHYDKCPARPAIEAELAAALEACK